MESVFPSNNEADVLNPVPLRKVKLPPLCWLITFLLVACCSLPALAQRHPVSGIRAENMVPTAAEIESWITELDANDFSVREAATKRFLRPTPEIVHVLGEIANGKSAEARSRAMDVLGLQLTAAYRDNDAEVIHIAETALGRLAEGELGAVSRRSNAIIESLFEVRDRWMVAEFLRMGGKLRTPLEGAQVVGRQLVVGRKWTGGDEGLMMVKRINGINNIYLIEGAEVSEQAIAELAVTHRVQRRRAAYLGITGGTPNFGDEKGCRLNGVEAGSAADRAGLKPADIIITFDGRDVEDFDSMIKVIGRKEPGDRVTLGVLREDRELTLPLIIGNWEEDSR